MALIVGGTTVTGTQTLQASTLTGTASAINGSNITNLPAPSTANVLSASAGTAVGAVGSYGFCGRNGSNIAGTYIRAGTTESANNIEWSASSSSLDTIATNPSGTWRCMGYCAWDASKSSLWLRIS